METRYTVLCYLADTANGKAGLDSRWPFAETVQFMYSGFARPTRSRLGRHHRTDHKKIFQYATSSTLHLPHAPLLDPATFRSELSFFPPAKVAKTRPCSSAPISAAIVTSERPGARNPIGAYGTKYMLLFAKVTVKGHVSKHASGHIRSPQPRHPLENSPGTSVHCRTLENFSTPGLCVSGGGLTRDCWVRSWRVDLCRVDRNCLWTLKVPRCTLERDIEFQPPPWCGE